MQGHVFKHLTCINPFDRRKNPRRLDYYPSVKNKETKAERSNFSKVLFLVTERDYIHIQAL